ncbi:hypothetical protein RB608_24820 [Nocardioides sp. LHD-245]|uniref:hypothetical protein n=1 Tax=Nocardioides sp. LHD-245 TaxID=3051387 RepID=UPI0027E0D02C|nr:hypothetical protein [Nocardioides sp. LHD-245]
MSAEAGSVASGLALLRAAGARVVPLEDFDHLACWVREFGILLVASDLTPDEWETLVEEYLPEILKECAAPS